MPQPEQGKTPSLASDLWLVAQLAWSLGWIIAVPAFAFGFGGAYLDQYFGTSPLLLLLGLGLAMALSAIGITRTIKRILGSPSS